MEGHVAIVTGGTKGIGRAVVEKLLSRQIKVAILSTNLARGEQTVADLSATHQGATVTFEQCDVTDDRQFKETFQKVFLHFGRVDILVNNAGVMDERLAREMVELNVRATIRGTELGVRCMSASQGGRGGVIVNMASTTGLLPIPALPVYAATKHAVIGYTRSVGMTSLAEHRVRVNCICPTPVDTGLINLDPSQVAGGFAKLQARIQQNGLLKPETVARCLDRILDDPGLSGAAIVCSPDQPCGVARLPRSLGEVETGP